MNQDVWMNDADDDPMDVDESSATAQPDFGSFTGGNRTTLTTPQQYSSLPLCWHCGRAITTHNTHGSSTYITRDGKELCSRECINAWMIAANRTMSSPTLIPNVSPPPVAASSLFGGFGNRPTATTTTSLVLQPRQQSYNYNNMFK